MFIFFVPSCVFQSIIFFNFQYRWGDYVVSEKNVTMKEVQKAASDGRLLEAFGAGTAAVVTPISAIEHKGDEIEIPATGDVTTKVWNELTDIQYGRTDHKWSIRI